MRCLTLINVTGGICCRIADLRYQLCRECTPHRDKQKGRLSMHIPKGFFLGASTFLFVTDRFGYGSVSHLVTVSLLLRAEVSSTSR